MGNEVFLYVPNIVGYIRIFLASAAFLLFEYPLLFAVLYSVSIALDGVDGYLARKLNQTSKFGAWFDVVIDLFSRGFLWCALYRGGYLVIMLEWLTFVSTHNVKGENWKIPEENYPTLVKLVMSKGFKSPYGIYAVGSLHILPLWLYGYESRGLTDIFSIPVWLQLAGIAFFTVGRTICAAVEVFYCKEYIGWLVRDKK